MVVRRLVACLLVLMLACPAFSNPGIIGTNVNSRGARVRGVELVPGSTVFSGDVIDVGAQGYARINLPDGDIVRLDANSQIRLNRSAEKTEIDLTRGRAAFRFSGGTLEARLADATIAPANGQEAAGVVELVNPTRALIVASKGNLLVTAASGKSFTVREGEGLDVAVAPAPQGGAQGSGLSHTGTIVVGAIIVGVLTAIGLAIGHIESKPSESERGAAVSPFRFP